MTHRIIQLLLAIIIVTQLAPGSQAAQVTVAVASNFKATMEAIRFDFERITDHKVTLVFGSSGKFYAQIKHGAPFHVFLSADQVKPAALENEGLTVLNSRFTYAIGALALWSSKPDFVGESAQVLKSEHFNKLAIANAQLAPYGTATKQVLQTLGIYNTVATKLVQGENIAQTYQFISTGNADLGFVALSQIVNNDRLNKGSVWIVPTNLYDPIRQDMVLLRTGTNNEAAIALVDYLKSDQVKALIKSHGYQSEKANQ